MSAFIQTTGISHAKLPINALSLCAALKACNILLSHAAHASRQTLNAALPPALPGYANVIFVPLRRLQAFKPPASSMV